MATQCNTCGGVYDRRQADGTDYYHVCPPIRRVLVTRAGRERYIDEADLLPGERVRGEVSVPRKGHRDENITRDSPDGEPHMKAEGAGVADVARPDPREGLADEN